MSQTCCTFLSDLQCVSYHHKVIALLTQLEAISTFSLIRSHQLLLYTHLSLFIYTPDTGEIFSTVPLTSTPPEGGGGRNSVFPLL